ncbi:MAG: FlgD immunoglobulin-like domain containing protein [Cyclobacteriaceae bacterium]
MLPIIISALLYFFPQKDTEFDNTRLMIPDRYNFVHDMSAVGDEDDPDARYNYEVSLQADPETGQIPWGIYQREIEFTKNIPERIHRGSTFLRTKQEEWTELGPVNLGGRTRAFAIDVTSPRTLIAGSVSGSMWRSESSGASWEQTSTSSQLIGATVVVQDTRKDKGDVWYYGTGEIRGNSARAPGAPYRGDGIFKSTDGARSWFQLESTAVSVRSIFNSQFNYVFDIKLNHTRADIDEVYAAVYGGILRSPDGGESWQAVLGDDLHNLQDTTDLNNASSPFFTEIEISEQGIFYAYLSDLTSSDYQEVGGVFRSEDGVNWADITPPNLADSSNRGVIAIAPSNENAVYLLVEHGTEGDKHSIWKYNHNGGEASNPQGTWDDLSDNVPAFGGDFGDYESQNSYNMVMSVHPSDEDIVFIGGTNLYRTTDGFRSQDEMLWIAGYDTANNGAQWDDHHADQHGLVFSNISKEKLFSTHDGGLSFTNQSSTLEYPVWTSINLFYITSQFYTVAQQMNEANSFITGGAQDNGTWLGVGNALSAWTKVLGGDGAYTAITDKFWIFSSQRSRIFRLIFDPAEGQVTGFARIDPFGAGEKPGQEYLFINPFEIDPNNDDRMYLAGGDAVWRNHNISQIPDGTRDKVREGWEIMESTKLDTGRVSAITASLNPSNVMYYGTSIGELYRVDEAHRGSGILTNITAGNFPPGNVSCVAVDPLNADHLLAVFSNYNTPSIFHSVDGGNSFSDIGGNLEENLDGSGNGPSARWAEIVPMADGTYRYYVGTSTGLYSTVQLKAFQTEWLREANNEIGQSVVTMVNYRPLDGRLIAASHGSGVFSTQIIGFDEVSVPGDPQNAFSISNPYPNPFLSNVTVQFNIPEDDIVLAQIFDVNGRWVRTPLWASQSSGINYITWDGRDVNGSPVEDGIYVIRILFKGESKAAKVLLQH